MISDHSQRGFSIVELAIVLVVLGLLVSGGLALYTPMIESGREKLARQRMDVITQTLAAHFGANYAAKVGLGETPTTDIHDLLPCPADPTATGTESAGVALSTCTTTTRGVVPWITLGLPPEVALDGWGRHFTYQAKVAGIHPTIEEYTDPTAGSSTPNAAEPEFVLVSHGTNGAGAFMAWSGNIYGTLTSNAENENWNGDAIFAVAPRSDNPVAPFDDLLAWRGWNQMVVAAGALIPVSNGGGGGNDDTNDGGTGDTPPSQGGNNGGGTGNNQCPDGSFEPCGGPDQGGGNNGGG